MKIINWLGPSAFLAAVISTLGYRFGFLHFRLSLVVFAIALIVCTLVLVAGIYKLAISIYRRRRFPVELVPLLLACALIPVLTVSNVGAGALSATMIHDITTDVDNPPAFVFIKPDDGFRINSLVYPGGEVSAKQLSAYPDIKTYITSLPPRRVFQKAVFAGSLLGWEIIATDLPGLRYEAVAKTPLFGFVDDIAVRITPFVDGGSAVDLRSMSRVGITDLGTNAKRIRSFLAELEAVLEQELINQQ
jgi:uncharacterized protein (DUF1499 family)